MGLLWFKSHAVEGTQVGPKMEIRGTKSQLARIFRVIPSHIIDINAYMLIFISKLTEITKIPENSEKVNFLNFSGYFGPEPSRSFSERSKQ